jgi:helicase
MDRVIYSDVIGHAERNSGPFLRECESIPPSLRDAFLQRFGNECRMTPIQAEAIEQGICSCNSHFIVSAPTNSGKTLVALFRIFTDLIAKRTRCVYVAPLKALAEEKKNEFEELSRLIEQFGGPKIRVAITTGDYQLTEDFLGSPPPDDGELIICTPERLEILLRSKENIFWARAAGTFVIDEFHLLGDVRRGATVEILVTRILASCPWSKIVALSATMGGSDAVVKWFAKGNRPVTLLENTWRYPTLDRVVVSTDDKESCTDEIVDGVLNFENKSLLIFVNQKRAAEKLCKRLQRHFSVHKSAITYLHAGLTLKERSERLNGLLMSTKRVIVTTTALKMGIDAPVTDVLVHDAFLWGGSGRYLLSYSDLLQMTGRAGRRDDPGNAVVLCNEEQGKTIVDLFNTASVDPLKPQLIKNPTVGTIENHLDPILSVLLSEIVVQGRATPLQLNEYLNHTFACTLNGPMDCLRQINELVRLKLTYKDEDDPDSIHPTKLGKTVSITGLSPESGAIIAGFLRALIKLDQKYEERKGRRFGYLRRLTDLDLIFLCCACHECRDAWIKAPSKQAVADTQEFIETLPPDEKPIINLWREETSKEYPTRRLLTSLRIPFDAGKKGQTEKRFYQIMRTAVLLYQHSHGAPLAHLSAKFKTAQGELENNLKFTVLWVLSCLSQICNGKRCYKFD